MAAKQHWGYFFPFRLIFALSLSALPSASYATSANPNDCNFGRDNRRPFVITYDSGLKAHVEAWSTDRTVKQQDERKDGQRVKHEWLDGVLPLENPGAVFTYQPMPGDLTKLNVGDFLDVVYDAVGPNRRTSGAMRIRKVAEGEVEVAGCKFNIDALEIETTSNKRINSVIKRAYSPQLRFFLATEVVIFRGQTTEKTEMKAVRIDLN
jgi:hypothetical protein